MRAALSACEDEPKDQMHEHIHASTHALCPLCNVFAMLFNPKVITNIKSIQSLEAKEFHSSLIEFFRRRILKEEGTSSQGGE